MVCRTTLTKFQKSGDGFFVENDLFYRIWVNWSDQLLDKFLDSFDKRIFIIKYVTNRSIRPQLHRGVLKAEVILQTAGGFSVQRRHSLFNLVGGLAGLLLLVAFSQPSHAVHSLVLLKTIPEGWVCAFHISIESFIIVFAHGVSLGQKLWTFKFGNTISLRSSSWFVSNNLRERLE